MTMKTPFPIHPRSGTDEKPFPNGAGGRREES